MLIAAGWRGAPGHALCFEIIPQPDNKASFRIYNLGAGVEEHHSAYVGNRHKFQPYIEWCDIEQKQLLDTHFWMALEEFNGIRSAPSDLTSIDHYNASHIYVGLKNLLKPQSVAKAADIYMTPQQAGICPTRSVMAFLRTKLGHDSYKRFHAELKIQTLVDKVQKAQNRTPLWHKLIPRILRSFFFTPIDPRVEERLLEKSRNKLALSIDKLYRQKIVGKKFLTSAQSQLTKLNEPLQKAQEHRQETTERKDAPSYSAPNEAVQKDHFPKEYSPLYKQLEELSPGLKQYHFYAQAITRQGATFSEIRTLAEQGWNDKEDAAVCSGLLEWISTLKVDEKAWKRTPEEAQKMCEDLSAIAHVLFKTYFMIPYPERIARERITAILKLQWIQCILANSIHENFIKTSGYHQLPWLLHSPFLVEADANKREEAERICQIRPFDEELTFDRYENYLLKVFNSRADLAAMPGVTEDLIRSIAPSIPGWKNLNNALRCAHIYASPLLPAWQRAIRDTNMFLMYLMSGKIANPAVIDRKTAFTFSLKVEELIHDSASVKMSIEGLTPELLNNPLVTQYQVHHEPLWRYRPNFRPFQSQDLEKLVAKALTSRCYSEKQLLSGTVTDLGITMPDEEYKELSHLFIKPHYNNKPHVKLLAYFTKHPEKIKDPDYQTLFTILFFELKPPQNAPFIKNVEKFITTNLERMLGENELQAALFLLQKMRELATFYPTSKELEKSQQKVRALLQRPGLAPFEKSLLYKELIVHLGQKKVLTQSEVQEFAIAYTYTTSNPIPAKWFDPASEHLACKAIHKHLKALSDYIKRDTSFINTIVSALNPTAKSHHWQKSQEQNGVAQYTTEDSKMLFDPLQGLLVTYNLEGMLPLDIVEHPHFKMLFPDVKKAIVKKGGIYQFTSAKGNPVLVKIKNGVLEIEQQLENRWHRFIPDHAFYKRNQEGKIECAFLSRTLINGYSHWHSLEDPQNVLLLNKNSQEIAYRATMRGQKIKEVVRIKDGLKLGTPGDLLRDFEHRSYTEYWYNKSAKQAEIYLPRYGLHFHNRASKEFPGYLLAKEQVVKELQPYRHYLVLENAQGQKKVLMPLHEQIKYRQDFETLLPEYAIDKELQAHQYEAQKYVTVDLKPNGRLETKSQEANLYLAQVLTLVQEYAKAAYYLKKYGEKLTKYSPQEKQILVNLRKIEKITGDTDPDATALRTYAGYLLQKNGHQLDLTESYTQYLHQYKKIGSLRLEKDEELFILRGLIKKQASPPIAARYKELTNQELPPELSEGHLSLARNQDLNALKFPPCYSWKEFSASHFDAMLLTQPKPMFDSFFYKMFTLAKEGTKEQKEKLALSLHFLGLGEKNVAEELSIKHFFELVLAHPDTFPSYPSDQNYEKKFTWQDRCAATAKELARQQQTAPTPNIPPSVKNATEAAFCLDEKRPQVAVCALNYKLPQIAPLVEASPFSVQELSDHAERQSGLLSWINTHSSADPLEQKELNRIKGDLTAYDKMQKPPVYALSNESLGQIGTILNKELTDCKALESQILALANKAPLLSVDKAKIELQKWGGMKKTLTLEELFIFFARSDTVEIRKKNEALDEADINTLYTLIGSYLQHKTLEQQQIRAKNLFDQYKQTQDTTLIQPLAEAMLARRCYDPEKKPAYLVFEYYADILIRPVQEEKLEAFLSGRTPNVVMEMIMGSGKSKVLLPLLGLLRADAKTLSLLIVPQPLFESVSSDTQHILREAFGQKLASLHFDRNTSITCQALENHIADLKTIISERRCLIMTSKSVACLILKLIEEAEKLHQNHKTTSKEYALLQELVSILHEYGYPIIDEADTILNVLHEVSFSLGGRTSPNPDEMRLISELYDLLLTDPELKSRAALECDPTKDPTAQAITEARYDSTVKLLLAQKSIKRLETLQCKDNETTKELNSFAKGLSRESYTQACNYLTRTGDLAQAEAFFETLPPRVQNLFALLGEEISSLMRHTLTKNSNEKYGLDEEAGGLFAIPFAAANTPSRGSHFANAYVTTNYTFQTYIKHGITHKQIVRALEQLQKDALLQMRDEALSLTETRAWKLFCTFKGPLDIPLFNYTGEHLEALYTEVNRSLAKKRQFVEEIILPQLELYEDKLSINPHNIVSFFKRIIGFTGTLWNGASMHRKLNPAPELGTDAKTLSLLWEKSRESIHCIKGSSMSQMLDEIGAYTQFDLLSDAGGYFKEGTNAEVAALLQQKSSLPVAFYDEQGQQMLRSGSEIIPLHMAQSPEGGRMTFLDQSHTTGADIKQKRQAVGLVTIGRNMLLRDLLQSAWRLRGLDKSQRVVFIVSEEVRSIICQELMKANDARITFEDILLFTIKNQAKRQSTDNFKAFLQQLWDIPQQSAFTQLLHCDLQPDAYKELRALWIKPNAQSAKERFGSLVKEQPIDAVIKRECDRTKVICHNRQETLREVTAVVDIMKEILPKTVITKGAAQDDGCDQTIEIEQESFVEVELEQQEQQFNKPIPLGTIPGYHITHTDRISNDLLQSGWLRAFDLGLYMQQDQALREYADAFSGISITTNVLEFSDVAQELAVCKLLGPQRTPFHFVEVEQDAVTLISENEIRGLANPYNLTLGFCNNDEELTPVARTKIVKLKFLNGDSHFTKEEIAILKAWFLQFGPQKMQKLYQEKILAGHPLKAIAYSNSSLQKLFRTIA